MLSGLVEPDCQFVTNIAMHWCAVSLSWRMLWEVIQDQVSGPTPILTRGNCRRWSNCQIVKLWSGWTWCQIDGVDTQVASGRVFHSNVVCSGVRPVVSGCQPLLTSNLAKVPIFACPKMARWVPKTLTETTFISLRSLKNHEIAFGFKRFPLLDGF